jgi:hypothetical protein
VEHHLTGHLGTIVDPHAVVAQLVQPTLILRPHLPLARAVGPARGRRRPLRIGAVDLGSISLKPSDGT